MLGRLAGHRSLRRRSSAIRTRRRCPACVVFRCNAALLYFNVDNVREHMVGMLERAPVPLRRIIIDLAFTTDLDLSTVRMLMDFARRAAEDGVAVHLADAHYRVRAPPRAREMRHAARRPHALVLDRGAGRRARVRPAAARARESAGGAVPVRYAAALPTQSAWPSPSSTSSSSAAAPAGWWSRPAAARSAPRSRWSSATGWAAIACGTAACRRRRSSSRRASPTRCATRDAGRWRRPTPHPSSRA